MRMRGASGNLPKPLVSVGGISLLDSIMRYYAHYGHTDFVLCLGYAAEAITEHFRRMGGEFLPTLSPEMQAIRLRQDCGTWWNVALVDTGLQTSIGQRLRLVERYVEGEELFLANYADGVTDLNLPEVIAVMSARPAMVAAMTAVRPSQSFHYLRYGRDGTVSAIDDSPTADLRINGGYFVFRQAIFRYLENGEDLVDGSFPRLACEGRLLAYAHDGFWRACDTPKDLEVLEAAHAAGNAQWEVWRDAPSAPAALLQTSYR